MLLGTLVVLFVCFLRKLKRKQDARLDRDDQVLSLSLWIFVVTVLRKVLQAVTETEVNTLI